MPKGTKVIASESSGISAWTKTAKVSAITPSGAATRYFLKCATGQGARALAEGEFHSANNINSVVPGFIPTAIGWGEYDSEGTTTYFFLGTFHDMDFSTPPEPEEIMPIVSSLHNRGTSPNGMFGYPVPVVCGRMERTVTWTNSWAESFTLQLKDVIKYDNDTNGPWPEYDVVCKQLIDAVIPRLLGALQSEGRDIKPTLIHGDLWERNVGMDMDTGNIVVFDPGCTYAHNEMEFGTVSTIRPQFRMFGARAKLSAWLPGLTCRTPSGDAHGRSISTHRHICACTSARSNHPSQSTSGMIGTGCTVSIHT